jgi:hypothetical protein
MHCESKSRDATSSHLVNHLLFLRKLRIAECNFLGLYTHLEFFTAFTDHEHSHLLFLLLACRRTKRCR